jgi:hemolysin activation/secretion protein
MFWGGFMRHSIVCFGALSILSTSVWTQTIPDAGSLMRQNEQSIKFEQMQRNAQRRESYPPAMTFTEATAVTATQIKFLGAKLLGNEQLQGVVQPFLNRPLNPNDLGHLTDAVANAYRRSGWLVRVYIPQQDLSQSELNIQILENMPSSGR